MMGLWPQRTGLPWCTAWRSDSVRAAHVPRRGGGAGTRRARVGHTECLAVDAAAHDHAAGGRRGKSIWKGRRTQWR